MMDSMKLVYTDPRELTQERAKLGFVLDLLGEGKPTDYVVCGFLRGIDVEQPNSNANTLELLEFWRDNARMETATERKYRVFSEVMSHPRLDVLCRDHLEMVFTEMSNMPDRSAETLLYIFESWLANLSSNEARVLRISKDFVRLSFEFSLQKMVFDKATGSPQMHEILNGGIIFHDQYGEPEWSQHT
jgi:hypothetical protein